MYVESTREEVWVFGVGRSGEVVAGCRLQVAGRWVKSLGQPGDRLFCLCRSRNNR
jgi:hypothetical protein